jgi:hypothetical protein
LVIGLHIIGFWSSGRICFYPKTSHQLDAETKAFKREACVKNYFISGQKTEEIAKTTKISKMAKMSPLQSMLVAPKSFY